MEHYLSQANQMIDDALVWYECLEVSDGVKCKKCFSCACQEVLGDRGVDRFALMAHIMQRQKIARLGYDNDYVVTR